MSQITKETYDGYKARFDLAEFLLATLQLAELATQEARYNEITFAANDEVDPSDFDDIRSKLSEVIKAARQMKQDHMPEDDYGYETQKNFD